MKTTESIRETAEILLADINKMDVWYDGLCVLLVNIKCEIGEERASEFKSFINKQLNKRSKNNVFDIPFLNSSYLFMPGAKEPRVRFLKAIIEQKRYVYNYYK